MQREICIYNFYRSKLLEAKTRWTYQGTTLICMYLLASPYFRTIVEFCSECVSKGDMNTCTVQSLVTKIQLRKYFNYLLRLLRIINNFRNPPLEISHGPFAH